MMLESLAKRLLFFGRVIVVTFLISLVAWLQKFDATDFREDVVDLSLLENLQSIPSLEKIRGLYGSTHDQALAWLGSAHPEKATRQSQARQKVTDWLNESGASEDELVSLRGKQGAKQAITPFDFMEITGAKEPWRGGDQEGRLRTVAELLDKLDALTMPTSIAFVIDIEEPLPRIKDDYHLKSAKLREQQLEMLMVERISQEQQQQAGSYTIALPVTIYPADNAPSLLHLSEPSRPTNKALEDLALAKHRKETLRRLYGLLPIDEAKSIASKGLTDAYQSVSIFGFSFSTQRFPFAVLACLILAVVGTLVTISTANRESLRILTDFSDPDVMDLLMDHCVGRVLLWAVLPPLAVVVSLPLVSISAYQHYLLVLAAVALAAAGLLCVKQARTV